MQKLNYKDFLEELYFKYNHKEFVNPDPLVFLYNYENIRDREIVGLIASSLAYGRVMLILDAVKKVLSVMGKSPYDYVLTRSFSEIQKDFAGFKYRFTTDVQISQLINAIKHAVTQYGSLEALFVSDINDNDDVTVRMEKFSSFLWQFGDFSNLIVRPYKNSACKRFSLYLRWMIRKDDVDPGGWVNYPADKLLVPLDTHMFRLATALGFTRRKDCGIKTAREITESFKLIMPDDPVKYDFALTRFGIRDDFPLFPEKLSKISK